LDRTRLAATDQPVTQLVRNSKGRTLIIVRIAYCLLAAVIAAAAVGCADTVVPQSDNSLAHLNCVRLSCNDFPGVDKHGGCADERRRLR